MQMTVLFLCIFPTFVYALFRLLLISTQPENEIRNSVRAVFYEKSSSVLVHNDIRTHRKKKRDCDK